MLLAYKFCLEANSLQLKSINCVYKFCLEAQSLNRKAIKRHHKKLMYN